MNIIKMSVDCTDCPINEPIPFDRKWFSHKFKHAAGVRYEIAPNIRTGEIVWINGLFQCGPWKDETIFAVAGLASEVEEGEMVHADKTYRGKQGCSTPYNQSFKYERDQSRVVQGRHETVNKRFKDFGALSTQFRHPLWKHGDVFRAVAVIVQLSLKRDAPLFHVEYRELTFLHHCLNHGTLDIVYKTLRYHAWLVPDKY